MEKRVEDKLKEIILSKHSSVKEFALSIKMSYTTLDSILKRGVEKANIINIIKICNALMLDVDALAEGKIKLKQTAISSNLTPSDQKLLEVYRSLNDEGQEKIMDYIDDLVESGKYIKNCTNGLVQEK